MSITAKPDKFCVFNNSSAVTHVVAEKAIILYTAVAVFAGALCYVGCTGNYTSERALWKINSEHKGAIKMPARVTRREFNTAVAELKKLISLNPDWQYAPQVQYSIAQMYVMRKEYSSAREEYSKVIKRYPRDKEICARAGFSTGMTYEFQGKWDRAMNEYQFVASNYSLTVTGLQAPRYIAEHYHRSRAESLSQYYYKRALDHYMDLIDRYPDSEFVPMIQDLAINIYARLNRMDDAIKMLKYISNRYRENEASSVALYKLGLIYSYVIKEPGVSQGIYKKIITEYPNTYMSRRSHYENGTLLSMRGNIEFTPVKGGKTGKSYSDREYLSARAQLALAIEYENEGKTDNAIKEFRKYAGAYPDTMESLYALLMAGQLCGRTGRNWQSNRIFSEIVSRSTQFARKSHDKNITARALEYKASALMMLKKWNRAVETLNIVYESGPGDSTAPSALYKMAVLYNEHLNNSQKSMQICRALVNGFPGHHLAYDAKNYMEKLHVGKPNKQGDL